MKAAADPVEVRVAGPGRVLLEGALTFANVATLWQRSDAVIDGAQGQDLEIDLGGISRADSAGLALLVGWLAKARKAGVALRYSHIPERLLAIARISEVDELLGGQAVAA